MRTDQTQATADRLWSQSQEIPQKWAHKSQATTEISHKWALKSQASVNCLWKPTEYSRPWEGCLDERTKLALFNERFLALRTKHRVNELTPQMTPKRTPKKRPNKERTGKPRTFGRPINACRGTWLSDRSSVPHRKLSSFSRRSHDCNENKK